jgi:hypothetical protein
MNSSDKAGAIFVTWVIVGALAFFTLPRIAETVSEDWVVLGVMGILALIGLGTTFILAVMTSTESKPSVEREPRERSKPKNSDTALVDRLLATMSDDELASLRRRLSADDLVALDDDGELVPLHQNVRGRR